MDPDNPVDAQQIVGCYAAVLEEHLADRRTVLSHALLPYSKDTIKRAIRTAMTSLAGAGRLTDDLRDFLEIAYTSLADYVDDDVARLMREYHDATQALADGGRLGRSQMGSEAWARLSGAGPIVAKVARAIAEESDALRTEFRMW